MSDQVSDHPVVTNHVEVPKEEVQQNTQQDAVHTEHPTEKVHQPEDHQMADQKVEEPALITTPVEEEKVAEHVQATETPAKTTTPAKPKSEKKTTAKKEKNDTANKGSAKETNKSTAKKSKKAAEAEDKEHENDKEETKKPRGRSAKKAEPKASNPEIYRSRSRSQKVDEEELQKYSQMLNKKSSRPQKAKVETPTTENN
jgi:hypothetical protein